MSARAVPLAVLGGLAGGLGASTAMAIPLASSPTHSVPIPVASAPLPAAPVEAGQTMAYVGSAAAVPVADPQTAPPPSPPPTVPTTRPPATTPSTSARDGSSLGTFVVTCYDNGGTTASGSRAGADTVAVDPSVIPLGETIDIQGVGTRVAADTGGAIKGHRLDIWEPSASDCSAWGVRTLSASRG